MVSMTTANCGWPITRRSTIASSSAPKAPIATTAISEADPVVEAPPDDRHVADEGAQHEQVALGEIDQLGRLVDQHEAERDQAVDAAHRQPVEGQL